ncbi:T9SS type B sorting domain-containing protein [Marinoscillum furvescens]|uniref:Gliding motility-associated-like protein n=1 Tax=Marinoscillum furvescens DSM 4134 TaxID=1122208 RepID=A0A3D9KXF5_MARFU|nr:gliding motility-associated C-terminal domain-containing protein [Marinoscillum furvescens]RED93184.1 gliding motility-associated-like protein [Marinoscillum furvescens DSM 4134]
MRVRYIVVSYVVAALLSITVVHATHIRAGEITARRINNVTRTFEFTFTGYRDSGSIIEFGGGIFRFGDGTSVERDFQIEKTPVGNDLEKVTFKLVHTYQAPNTYIVSYEEEFRNEGIINMDNSVNTTFYVESMIVIDPFFGLNNTPELTVPPIDFAAVGAQFIHNPGAFDSDGDSLSYRFTIPKQGNNMVVNNYRDMNDPAFYTSYSTGNQAQNGQPTLTIDPVSGDLIWDSPGDVLNQDDFAEYNVAFVVEEWRFVPITGEWIRLGYVTRDMQIIVEETDNERPELEVPEDVCVEAGEKVEATILGSDPDGHPVMLEGFGGPFEFESSPAYYSPDPAEFQETPGSLLFEWETTCGHVRARPYEVQFKVTDNPEIGPRLVNFETFEITVVGPAPDGLSSTVQPGRGIQLNWNEYACPNATRMQIWRRVGDFDIEVDDCVVGMPPNAGYRLIEEIDMVQQASGGNNEVITEYLDNNKGRGLAPGAKYCYRLVAVFPSPGGGESYVSTEVCDSILIDAPVITNVDVEVTGEVNGTILVQWTPPYQADQSIHPPAYTYDVYRGEGAQNSASYVKVAEGISDTDFTDTGLNTFAQSYNYYVSYRDANGVLADSSATASNVRLDLSPLLRSIELKWSAEVPWSNTAQRYPYHYIYRDQVLEGDMDELVLIDSVDVTQKGYVYLDNGAFNGVELDEEIEYCYFVKTQGTYGSRLLPEPLENRSQISCGQPNDTIPPCAPPEVVFSNDLDCEALVASRPCESNIFTQKLSWDEDMAPDCDDDIVFYRVYYSETGLEEDYVLVGEPVTTSFNHEDLTSLKGCYQIASVDRSGNESSRTASVCNDNCPVYKFPNAFTPNGDGKNDVFAPLNNDGLNISPFDNSNCPRFIRAVKFKVFDRSGKELYVYDSFENPNGIYINWDGTNKFGEKLPAGTYFYSAEVEVDVLDPKDSQWILNGWVKILK